MNIFGYALNIYILYAAVDTFLFANDNEGK